MRFVLLAGMMAVSTMTILVAAGCGRSPDVSTKDDSVAALRRGSGALEVDARRQQLVGVKTVPVVRGTLTQPVRAPGVVTYDASRLTDVNLRLDGWIRELSVNQVGQHVKAGEALFSLYSQELQGAQLQYLAAIRSLEQLTPTQRADLDYQERLIQTPKQRLLNWDVPPDQLEQMQKRGAALDAVVFRSPVDGVVIEQVVVQGMHVMAGQTLYKIADTSTLWVEADFAAGDAGQLRDGSAATVIVDAAPPARLTGKILSQYPALSGQTRTIKVRIEVPSGRSGLKPGMFVSVEVMTPPRSGLVIPADAVIDSGRRQTVFVAEGNGYFQPRSVTVGDRAEDRLLITSGLSEGEQVVSRAAFLVDSESQLSAALDSYRGQQPDGSESSAATNGVTLRFETETDSPAAAATGIRVQLDDKGAPVTDATVDAKFSMSAMPSMNMPAMQASARLAHATGSVYRGTVSLPMAGRWDVAVSAYRGGTQVASEQTSIVVR
jgi:RND family efflux transporter MFP subunit